MGNCSASMQILQVGNARTCTITVLDAQGKPFAPATVFAWSFDPNGNETSLTVDRTLAAQGMFSATFTATVEGPWVVRFSDVATPPTGASFTIEEEFTYTPLAF